MLEQELRLLLRLHKWLLLAQQPLNIPMQKRQAKDFLRTPWYRNSQSRAMSSKGDLPPKKNSQPGVYPRRKSIVLVTKQEHYDVTKARQVAGMICAKSISVTAEDARANKDQRIRLPIPIQAPCAHSEATGKRLKVIASSTERFWRLCSRYSVVKICYLSDFTVAANSSLGPKTDILRT